MTPLHVHCGAPLGVLVKHLIWQSYQRKGTKTTMNNWVMLTRNDKITFSTISHLNQTVRSWEYRKWSQLKKALDFQTNSPLWHYMGNMWKTVWRIFILMLKCNGLSLGSRDRAEQRALLPLLWSMFISWPSITFGMSLLLVLDFTLRIFLWVPPFFPL